MLTYRAIQRGLLREIPQVLVVLEAEDDARQHPRAGRELGGRSACTREREASYHHQVCALLLSCYSLSSYIRSSPVHRNGDPMLPAANHDVSSHVQVVLCDFEFPYYGRRDIKHITVVV